MMCPSISELPPPPLAKTGWPWTEESRAVLGSTPEGSAWPRITIVTPSYNQAEYLEETIRSVLLQGYPALEYVVIDGGSQDGSVEIIQKYAPWLAYWVSEPDEGQSDAINKGLRHGTGEVFAWLNSDDIYYPEALKKVGEAMASREYDIFLGGMDKVQIDGDEIHFVKTSSPHEGTPFYTFPILADGHRYDFHFYQPSMFWSRELWEETGGLDERYQYAMDVEWCHRALATGPKLLTDDAVLTRFTLHPGSKSQDMSHLQHQDFVVMFLRLSRTPGFRPAQCLLSALIPAQRMLAIRAQLAIRDGERTKAALLRTGARLIRAIRLGIPGLRGASNLRSGGSAA